MDSLEEITEKINELTTLAETKLEAAKEDSTLISSVKEEIEKEIKPQLMTLQQAHEEGLREVEFKAMQAEVTDLKTVLENLREPGAGFALGDPAAGVTSASIEDDPYGDGSHSIFYDIKHANKGDKDARERLTLGVAENGWSITQEGKAMTEGVAAQGGYLVRPQIERQLVEARESDNVVRALVSKLNVTTNQIQLDQLGLSTIAGWVAELAQKPELTGMTLATVTASVFTAAGLATISNQLLADANPAVDRLATSDLTKRLVALEENAFIDGSGTNQPLGILGTPGVTATVLASTEVSADGGLFDAVLDSILKVQTNHGQPTAILMHPRTWTRIIKDKDAVGAYTIGSPGVETARPATGTLFGVPVVLSNRIPTNKGVTTNESRLIVGDFREALILDRQGITVDQSEHVYFTTNQTVFRAETRVGFTAARTPQAFDVVGGPGMANG